MGEDLFRKTALDKLASPERLDVLMEVTSPKGWLALAVMGVVLDAVLVWSILGSMPEKIDGQGELIRGGGLRQLRSSGDGTLTKLVIELNSTVKVGQQIGTISQIGSSDEIKAAQQKLEQAQREYDTSKAEDEASIAGLQANISGVDANKRSTQLQLQKAQENLNRLQEAFGKGLVTRNRVQQAERDVENLKVTITGYDGQVNGLRAQQRSMQQRIRAKADGVAQANTGYQRLVNESAATASVTSTVEGRVIELKKRIGDRVGNAEVIATVEPPSSALEPFVLIPAANGKRIKDRMEAQVSPSTVRREEYGFMKGEVRTVGDYPVTPDALEGIVGNKQVATELLGSGSKILVQVTLIPDTATPSGYSWSSSSGPPFKIDGGTKVVVSFVVDRKPPIAQVLPFLSRFLKG